MLSNDDSKKELLKLVDVENSVPANSVGTDGEGGVYEKRAEEFWRKKNAKFVVEQVMKAKNLWENKKEKEDPLTLLKGALKKLNHEKMEVKSIILGEPLSQASQLCKEIKAKAQEIESEIYHWEKEAKELFNKKKNNAKQKINN